MQNSNLTNKTLANCSLSIKDMAVIAVMTAILCIIGPWSLTIPFSPVPLSLCSMGIYFAVSLLGGKRGSICTILYLLLGSCGLPVFSGFSGGLGKLCGPTGGYLIGYFFLAVICGFFLKHFPTNGFLQITGFLLGTAILYLFGTLWLQFQMQLTFLNALALGVIPYIPGDIVKLILAISIASPIKKRLKRANLC